MTRTIDQMIASEVLCCMSSLVARIAHLEDHVDPFDIQPFVAQAIELSAPVDDWEEAAIQAGVTFNKETASNRWRYVGSSLVGSDYLFDTTEAASQAYCRTHDVTPYEREVYEHWAVTDWFADKLEAAGEKVDRDFAGLAIWARTTTGQQIAADGVIQRIYAETHTGLDG